MSDKTQSPPSTIDPYKHLKIKANHDGTITRYKSYPPVAATPDPADNVAVLSKDVTINKSNNVWARIFLPRQTLLDSSSNKLPLIFYYQPGGFIFPGVASIYFHEFCSDVASQVPAIVVSLEYRLAPEHRLPAAYDDAMEALNWTKTTQEEWITNYADMSCCFLFGACGGANIAYHVGLRVAAEADNLLPLKIRGLILHQPGFGGIQRTESELRLANNPIVPLTAIYLMIDLALPIGADHDHEYSNPTIGGGSKLIDKIRLLGWKVMVIGCDGDPYFDRQVELAKLLEQKGVQVESHFDRGGNHGVEFREPAKRKVLFVNIKEFVRKTKDGSLFERGNPAHHLKLHAKI